MDDSLIRKLIDETWTAWPWTLLEFKDPRLRRWKSPNQKVLMALILEQLGNTCDPSTGPQKRGNEKRFKAEHSRANQRGCKQSRHKQGSAGTTSGPQFFFLQNEGFVLEGSLTVLLL
jgi:hypothetical protein